MVIGQRKDAEIDRRINEPDQAEAERLNDDLAVTPSLRQRPIIVCGCAGLMRARLPRPPRPAESESARDRIARFRLYLMHHLVRHLGPQK